MLDSELYLATVKNDLSMIESILRAGRFSNRDLGNAVDVIVNADYSEALALILDIIKIKPNSKLLGRALVATGYYNSRKVLNQLLSFGVDPNYIYLEHDAFLGAIAMGYPDIDKDLLIAGYTVCLPFSEKRIKKHGSTYREYTRDIEYKDIYQMLLPCQHNY